MKTFTEAFEKIQTDNLLHKNLVSFKAEQMGNKKFVQFATEIAMLWENKIAFCKDGMELPITCATIQSVFNAGLLTGMEMEKE